jgi:hypothetical protein
MRGAERATAIGLKAALLVDVGRFDTFAIKVQSNVAKRIIADTVASVCRTADTFIGPLHVTAPPTYLMTEEPEAQLAELVVPYAQKYWNGLLKAMGLGNLANRERPVEGFGVHKVRLRRRSQCVAAGLSRAARSAFSARASFPGTSLAIGQLVWEALHGAGPHPKLVGAAGSVDDLDVHGVLVPLQGNTVQLCRRWRELHPCTDGNRCGGCARGGGCEVNLDGAEADGAGCR